MSVRGSQLQRAVTYFREGPIDEIRVAFQLAKEVVEARLAAEKSKIKSQTAAAEQSRPKRTRRTKAQIEADKAQAPGKPPVTQMTVGDGANAAGQPSDITVS